MEIVFLDPYTTGSAIFIWITCKVTSWLAASYITYAEVMTRSKVVEQVDYM